MRLEQPRLDLTWRRYDSVVKRFGRNRPIRSVRGIIRAYLIHCSVYTVLVNQVIGAVLGAISETVGVKYITAGACSYTFLSL